MIFGICVVLVIVGDFVLILFVYLLWVVFGVLLCVTWIAVVACNNFILIVFGLCYYLHVCRFRDGSIGVVGVS